MASAADRVPLAALDGEGVAVSHRPDPDPAFARLRCYAGMAPLQVLRELESSLHGLDERAAQDRLVRYGDNVLSAMPARSPLACLGRALLDPFVIVLVLLGVVSALTGDRAGLVVISCCVRPV